MLSKLFSKQVLNHGLRLTSRAASTKPKLVVDRKPEVKYQKVCRSLKINTKFNELFSLAFY